MLRIFHTTGLLYALVTSLNAEPATITVDPRETGRDLDLAGLLGGNIAVWYQPEHMASRALKDRFTTWKPGLLRLPGGSWSDELIWNGNGIRKGGAVDTARRVDGEWQIDYSGFAPGFRLKANPNKPGGVIANDYHGNLDIRALHEFARDHKARALVTVNMGTGTPKLAAEWLKWTRASGYDVAYWEIGNELDGEWELGHIMPNGKRMTDTDYARKFREFATAMKAVDPNAKVGGPACSNEQLVFVETLIRDAGDILDFVSFHTYPVEGNMADPAEQFAKASGVKTAVEKIRGWIRQYHPAREGQIAIGVSEWHKQVMETRTSVDLDSGLWACLFIGAMAESGVSFANVWDCFSQTETGGHGLFDHADLTPRAIYHALSLWRHHMRPSLLKAEEDDPVLKAFATRDKNGVSVMIVNTSRKARKTALVVGGAPVKGSVRAHRFSQREYFWNPHANRPQWSLPATPVTLRTDDNQRIEIPASSVIVVDIPDSGEAAATVTTVANKPELALMLPAKCPGDLPVEGFVAVMEHGGKSPWQGVLPEVSLKVDGPARLLHGTANTADTVGSFTIQPTGTGRVTVTAGNGELSRSASLVFTKISERKQIVWTFDSADSLKNIESNFAIKPDSQVRPNQSVASVHLDNAISQPQKNTLLAINTMPDGFERGRVGGITAVIGASHGLQCDDKGGHLQIVLQSNNDHWIPLGSIPLTDLAGGPREFVFRNNDPRFREAMPELYAVRFMLNSTKPVSGVIHIDDVGFILRSE